MVDNVNFLKGKKYFLTHPDGGIEMMLHKQGAERADCEWSCDFMIFPGGADVHPLLYGQRVLEGTFCNVNRDLKEVTLFKDALLSLPKVGICRGAQLTNVLSGGKLFQDVDKHTRTHDMVDTRDGRVVSTTSTHHQMMLPSEEALIIARAGESTKRTYEHKNEVHTDVPDHSKHKMDYEVLFYEHTNTLCFQGHPEYDNKDCLDYFLTLLERHLDEEETV